MRIQKVFSIHFLCLFVVAFLLGCSADTSKVGSDVNQFAKGTELKTCALDKLKLSSSFAWLTGSWIQAIHDSTGNLISKTYQFDFTKEPAIKTAFYFVALSPASAGEFCYIRIENQVVQKREVFDLDKDVIRAELSLISLRGEVLTYSGPEENLKKCNSIKDGFLSFDGAGAAIPHSQTLNLKCNSLAVDQLGLIYTKQN